MLDRDIVCSDVGVEGIYHLRLSTADTSHPAGAGCVELIADMDMNNNRQLLERRSASNIVHGAILQDEAMQTESQPSSIIRLG
jgi:hypothetical protein